MKEITITSLEEGQRLERVLQRYLSKASAGFLYKMLRKKNITLNGKKADGKDKLRQGDVIRIYFSEETLEKFTDADASGKAKPWPVTRLDILYEDAQILLVNKPAGMLSQKAAPSDVSLNEYAVGYLLESGAVSEESLKSFRPSVCNRLDRNTSGIVTVGKTTAALQELSQMFRARTVHKYYQALVAGDVEEEKTIDAYLVKDGERNQVRILPVAEAEILYHSNYIGEPAASGAGTDESAESEQRAGELGTGEPISSGLGTGEPAARRIRTRYVPVAHRTDGDSRHALTLMEIELITGRPHQIRAHLSAIGHPVIGDPKYGSRRRNEYFAREYGLKGQLLHAGRIAFPENDGALGYLSGREFTAPRPAIFERILREEQIEMAMSFS